MEILKFFSVVKYLFGDYVRIKVEDVEYEF